MSCDHALEPDSPCIGVCLMNSQTDLCDGCFRSLDEIAQWWHMSAEQKRQVLRAVEERQEKILDGTFFD
ncbi:MAG TPA: DUF1289 domain-containing protein [Candidatus Competibacteraceae bacterium]|nr:DUF1289 domain-containing protein [Candidatus Competibacteraceae bacterium]